MKNGIQPFLAGEADNYRYGHMLSAMAVKSYGPEFQDKLAAREFNYDSPEVVSLIQEIKDMQDKGYFGENVLSVDVPAEHTYFGAGDCAFMIDLSRAGAILKDSECFKAKKLHTAKFPYFDEQYATSNMGGASQNYFVCTLNKSVNQIKASLKVLKWLTSQEFVDELVQEYPSTYSVLPSEGSADNYMFEECTALMQETENYVQELAQVSKNTAELTIVRNALQLLGSAIASGMAAAGGEIALCDINEEQLKSVQEEIEKNGRKASSHVMNVTDKESIHNCVEEIGKKYGHIDVLGELCRDQ